MLQSIRDKAQGWIAWAIVILISVPFALWGIQEYLGVGGEPLIAKVNDREITVREVDNAAVRFRNQLRQRLGAQYQAELFEESVLRKQILENLIRETLIQQATRDLGLRAGNTMVQQTIMSIPAFQIDGQFNKLAYAQAVQIQGLTETAYEERLRSTLATRQLEMALADSSFVVNDRLNEMNSLAKQTRDLAYIRVPASRFIDDVSVSDDEVKSFYESNKASYMADERVKLEYLLLNLDTIAKNITATDADLKNYFDENKDQFVVADRKRLAHILFEVSDDATDEQVREKLALAEKAYERLQNGEDFSALAKELSDDVGSSDAGGDLGFIETDVLDPAMVAAASSLELDDYSKPVRTRFGYHLIKVLEVKKGTADDFETVRDQVKTAYLKAEAERIFYDQAEQLSNIVYEVPDTLSVAADELNLELQQSDWITRAGGEGVLASPKVTNAAFSDDVLIQGNNSEAIELSPNEIIVLRVNEHEEPAVRDLAEVRDEVIKTLKQQKAAKLAKAYIDDLLKQVTEDKMTLDRLATETGLSVSRNDDVSRNNFSIPKQIVNEAFKVHWKDQPVHLSVALDGGDMALLSVTGVKEGEPLSDEKKRASARDQINAERGQKEFDLFVKNLRLQADITYIK